VRQSLCTLFTLSILSRLCGNDGGARTQHALLRNAETIMDGLNQGAHVIQTAPLIG
jgi:hypothetical protein